MLTALIRDLHRAYPGRYEIGVDSNWMPVWLNNPYLAEFADTTNVQKVVVQWGHAIDWHSYAKFGAQRAMRHALAWYHYDFTRQTGIAVPVTEPCGELFLTAAESKPILEGRYWVIAAGGKLDTTVKLWDPARYQQVADALRARGIGLVQCGATYKLDVHTPLTGCLNMIGKTGNVRDLFNLIQHAEGVICPVTSLMHIAAVFQKPCVVLAGGREEPWFEWYGDGFEAFGPGCKPVAVPHKFLHTIGLLPCCKEVGCWRDRTAAVGPEDITGLNKQFLCYTPERVGDMPIPACMNLLQPEHVVNAVMDYYDAKILPPITPRPTASGLKALLDPSAGGPYGPIDMSALASKIVGFREPSVEILPPPDLKVLRPPSGPIGVLRPDRQAPPPEYKTIVQIRNTDMDLLDNPIVGGKYTLFVLCYGPYTHLAKQCLGSILATVPRDRLDLRVATNAAVPATLEYLRGLDLDHLYVYAENRMKYPVMRDLFNDPDKPITTPYLIWFDDDAYAVDPKWIVQLSATIIANHRAGNRLYGMKMFHDLTMYSRGHNPATWFTQAPWYKGRNFRARNSDAEAPNGSCIDFAAGWFWACGVDAIRAADVPDKRCHHSEGDIVIGEQIHQAGYKIKDFNRNKSLIFTPPKDQGGRRGYEEAFPWVDPAHWFEGNYPTQYNQVGLPTAPPPR